MEDIYFDVLPRDILKIIVLEIEDMQTFEILHETGISSITSLLKSEDFWKSKVGALFPKGGDKYINSYLTTFNDGNINIILMKYEKLRTISGAIDDVLMHVYQYAGFAIDYDYNIFISYFRCINNYECLKLNYIPYDLQKSIIKFMIDDNNEFRVLHIKGNFHKYRIVIDDVKYELTDREVRDIIGHIVSNGALFDGQTLD